MDPSLLNAGAELLQPRTQHFVIVAAQRIARDVTDAAVGERPHGVGGILRPVTMRTLTQLTYRAQFSRRLRAAGATCNPSRQNRQPPKRYVRRQIGIGDAVRKPQFLVISTHRAAVKLG